MRERNKKSNLISTTHTSYSVLPFQKEYWFPSPNYNGSPIFLTEQDKRIDKILNIKKGIDNLSKDDI